MMKNKWIALIMVLLLLAAVPMAQAAAVIQRPDQYFTIMMYRSAAVERMPGTEITSFERDQNDQITSHTFLLTLSLRCIMFVEDTEGQND